MTLAWPSEGEAAMAKQVVGGRAVSENTFEFICGKINFDETETIRIISPGRAFLCSMLRMPDFSRARQEDRLFYIIIFKQKTGEMEYCYRN